MAGDQASQVIADLTNRRPPSPPDSAPGYTYRVARDEPGLRTTCGQVAGAQFPSESAQ